jgi:hypothetical protein
MDQGATVIPTKIENDDDRDNDQDNDGRKARMDRHFDREQLQQ